MYRLTIKDILEATGGVLLCGDENTEIKDVCINSKEIKPGDLFVPIIGERVDAHRFIESALHTGAATLTSDAFVIFFPVSICVVRLSTFAIVFCIFRRELLEII